MRAMRPRPAALAAGLAEIEKERAELLAKAAGKRDQKDGRARQLLARMPDMVSGYRAQVQRAIAVLAKSEAVEDGRESMLRLLEDGRITLAPNPPHTAVAGPVYLKKLGEHVLELAGLQRRRRNLQENQPPGQYHPGLAASPIGKNGKTPCRRKGPYSR